jgi:hypothetical protein
VGLDSAGDLVIVDAGNSLVRKVHKGIISTIAGTEVIGRIHCLMSAIIGSDSRSSPPPSSWSASLSPSSDALMGH